MIQIILTFICVALFILAIREGFRTYGSILPDTIVPRMDLMVDPKNNPCAPPPCAVSSDKWDLRDTGLAMSGCSKIFIPNEEKVENNPGKDYYEQKHDEFFQYRINAGREVSYRDIYDSLDRIQKSVYQSPKDTLHEITTNKKYMPYLTPAY